MYINTIYITLNYKCTLYMEIIYTNCLINSLNIYTGKTPVFNFGTLFSYPSADRKLYYNSSLFLNKSIDPTNINL